MRIPLCLFNLKVTILAVAFLLLLGACNTAKKTTYFQDLQTDTTLNNLVSKSFETKIQPGDLLSITIASLSPENAAIYNAPPNNVGSLPGFLVDKAGNIDFIKLGKIQVAGLTREELRQKLQTDLQPYLAQTVVAVGYLNRHITLLGAISPQVLPMTTEHMTIFDALAASGDIGTKGKSDNVLVIREKENGKERDFKRLNLTDKSIFYSPYFYMQPNDIVYVEPLKEKTNNTLRIVSYVTTGITFVLFILDRLFK